MKEVSLIRYFLISFILKRGFAVLLYRHNTSAVTWNEARQECVGEGGNLVNGSFERQLFNCTFQSKSEFWVGTYNTFSSWIQIIGCFLEDVPVKVEQHEGGDAISCAEKCFNYFGITRDKCYCLQRNFTSEQNAVADQLCNITCPDDQDSCGGEGYFTVYKTVPDYNVNDRIDDTDRNEIMCGCVECTNNKWEYFGYSCNRSLPAYCSNTNAFPDYEHWNVAQDYCWTKQNSFLLGGDIDECGNWNISSMSPHWIGLYRRKTERTLNDANLPSAIECFSGRLSAGILYLKKTNCTSEMPFVCELDTDDILPGDCLLERLETTTSMLTTELTSDIMTTESVTTAYEQTTLGSTKPTTHKASVTSRAKEDSNNLSAGALVGIIIGIVIIALLLIGTMVRRCFLGQKPTSTSEQTYDTVQLRNKEDFYARPPSYNQDMAEIRYSLFDNDKNILVPEEPSPPLKRPIVVPEVTVKQTEDGRFSTFVTVKPENGDAQNGHVNVEDQLTKL